jgi:hypothetical protein
MARCTVKEDAMKSAKVLAVAAAMFAMAGMMGGAGAQQPAPLQGNGYMMGPGMMGPNGMMNNGTMGPWMMGQNGTMPMMGGTVRVLPCAP